MLRIYGVVLEVLRDLRGVLAAIEERDPNLARQARRAATSVALNVAEGSHSQGRNRRARYYNALGSMQETIAAAEVAMALGYVDAIDQALLERMRRIVGTLVKLVA